MNRRLHALLLRDLGASSARILEEEDTPGRGTLIGDIPGGLRVELTFDTPPKGGLKVLARRLGMLISAFGDSAVEKVRARNEDPRSRLLRELAALVKRSEAYDAVVIDAQSPVVWASAEDDTKDRLGKRLRDRAITFARHLSQMDSLSRGGHLAVSHRSEDFGVVIRAVAGIYALILIFDHAFDEIRAERSLKSSLPRIERLILALPPIDPDPTPAGVVALRARRRKR